MSDPLLAETIMTTGATAKRSRPTAPAPSTRAGGRQSFPSAVASRDRTISTNRLVFTGDVA